MTEPRIERVPTQLPEVTPGRVRDALIDATAEFAKIDPGKIDIGDMFGLAMVYGALSAIVNKAADRQAKE